jgi:hypothetical protein
MISLKDVVEGWNLIHNMLYKAGFHYFFSIAGSECPHMIIDEDEQSLPPPAEDDH